MRAVASVEVMDVELMDVSNTEFSDLAMFGSETEFVGAGEAGLLLPRLKSVFNDCIGD